MALIVGNQLGTSLTTLPAAVAGVAGPLGILAWIVAALGFFMLAEVYASLGPRFPRTGGPYVFALEGLGRFAGFQTVWCHWFGVVVGNVAIATGVIAYLAVFIPALDRSAGLRFVLGQGLLWGCALLNVRGIREPARVQTVILALNVIPFVLLLVALRAFDPANFHPFAPKGYGAVGGGVALLVWAFSGVESATVTAEEVRGHDRLIRTATRIGFGLAALMFILAAVVLTGVLPNAVIAGTPRPLGLAVATAIGPWAATVIAAMAVVSAFACLNGWMLLLGRIPLSAAADGLFFAPFARVHPRYGTPHVGLLAGTAISSLLLFTYFSRDLLAAFEWLVLLANFATLVPYLTSGIAAVVICWRPGRLLPERDRRWTLWCALGATVFLAYALVHVDAAVRSWGLLVVVAGVPLYILQTRRRGAGPLVH